MKTPHPSTRLRMHGRGAAALVSIAAAAAVLACGGGGDEGPAASGSASAAADAGVAAAPADKRRAAPLFDDRGRPLLSPPSAQPADTAARTRQGLYASRDQLEWEELTVGIHSIVIDVDAEGGVDAAVRRARMLRAWHGNDGAARVYYVRGRDLVAAARVVDTLSDEGFGWVYMVP